MTASWIKREGWLKDYVKPKPRPVVSPKPQEEDVERLQVFTPIICPKCESRNVRSYGADKPVLYYRCQKCHYKFKVIEKTPPTLAALQSEQKKALIQFKHQYDT